MTTTGTGLRLRRIAMRWKSRGWTLVNLILLAMPGLLAMLTVVAVGQGTVWATLGSEPGGHAGGPPPPGPVLGSWPPGSAGRGRRGRCGGAAARGGGRRD